MKNAYKRNTKNYTIMDYINSIDFIVRSMEEGKINFPVLNEDQNSDISQDEIGLRESILRDLDSLEHKFDEAEGGGGGNRNKQLPPLMSGNGDLRDEFISSA
jgi:hypothetical protein